MMTWRPPTPSHMQSATRMCDKNALSRCTNDKHSPGTSHESAARRSIATGSNMENRYTNSDVSTSHSTGGRIEHQKPTGDPVLCTKSTSDRSSMCHTCVRGTLRVLSKLGYPRCFISAVFTTTMVGVAPLLLKEDFQVKAKARFYSLKPNLKRRNFSTNRPCLKPLRRQERHMSSAVLASDTQCTFCAYKASSSVYAYIFLIRLDCEGTPCSHKYT